MNKSYLVWNIFDWLIGSPQQKLKSRIPPIDRKVSFLIHKNSKIPYFFPTGPHRSVCLVWNCTILLFCHTTVRLKWNPYIVQQNCISWQLWYQKVFQELFFLNVPSFYHQNFNVSIQLMIQIKFCLCLYKLGCNTTIAIPTWLTWHFNCNF